MTLKNISAIVGLVVIVGGSGYTNLVGTIAFAADLDRIEEKSNQNTLKINKERYARLLENARDTAWQLKKELREEYGNKWRELFGEDEARELEEALEAKDDYKQRIHELDKRIKE